MTDAAKRKLKAGLKRNKLVAPLTWNRRTGNLVGGHQRLSQLDSLAGTANYELDVAVIDVDEAREKEINILLNNQSSMGDWDMDALSEMVRDKDVDIAGTGFEHADIFRLFGDDVITTRENDPLDELANKIREARALHERITGGEEGGGEAEFYMVVVFRDGDQLTRFLKAADWPDNRYQSGEALMAKLGIELDGGS